MPSRRFRSALPAVLFACTAFLAACSSTPSATPNTAAEDQIDDNNDPLESVNRDIFDFDLTVDKYFFRPIAKAYRDTAPDFVRTAVHNVLSNLKSPLIMVNDALQGNPDLAAQTYMRILINTTVGLGGMIDIASKGRIPYHDSDFGQTLGVWGVPSGPYLVLPLLFSSDPRDAVGFGVESYADPFSLKMSNIGMSSINYARTGVTLVSERSEHIEDFDELQRSSLDFYAAIRSLYQQRRAADVQRGKSPGNTSYVPEVSDAGAAK